MAVVHGDQWRAPFLAREQTCQPRLRVRAAGRPLRGEMFMKEEVGAGDHEDVGEYAILLQNLSGSDRLRYHRARRKDMHDVVADTVVTLGASIDQPICASQNLLAELVLGVLFEQGVEDPLVDWLGRESQVGAPPAFRIVQLLQCIEQDPFHLLSKCGLIGNDAGQLETDAGSNSRLMRTTFVAERYA